MRQNVGMIRRRFHGAIKGAVDELGGDRSAERLSGVSKSIWYDAKTGRSLPDPHRTWPAMRVVLDSVASSRTGVEDWDALYHQVREESAERSPTLARGDLAVDLPADTKHFVGRDQEIAAVVDALSTPIGVPGISPICVVHGMAGVGKTTLAVRAARLLTSHFDDGCMFVALHTHTTEMPPVSPAETLGRLLRRLGVGYGHVPPHLDERAAMFRRRVAGRRLLFVFDDARDAGGIRSLLPAEPGCGVLVTSRSHLAALDDGIAIQLDPLPPGQAVQLFRAVVVATEPTGSATLDAESVRRIVRACAHIPLGVRIAAARFRTSRRSALTSSDGVLDAQDRLAELDDGERSVVGAVAMSRRELPPDEGRLFDLLALHAGPDIDIHAIAALTDMDAHKVRRPLDIIRDRHLLEQPIQNRYQFHDLIGAVARQGLKTGLSDDDRQEARGRLGDYYLAVSEKADALITPYRYRIDLKVLRPPLTVPDLDDYDEALRWLTEEEDNLSAVCRTTDTARLDELCWQLAYVLKGYYFLTKRWEPWVATHESALAATRRLQDQRAEAITSNHLGLAMIEQGDDEVAAVWYRRAFDLFRSLGDEHGVHTALANQAWIRFNRHEYEEFIAASLPSLDFYQRAGAGRNAAITQRGIGLAEMHLGRTGEALSQLNIALETFVDLGLRLDIAMTLNCLGEVQLRLGGHGKAAGYHRQAIAAALESGSTFELARAHRRLGDLAADRGQPNDAQTSWRQALDLYESLGASEAFELTGLLSAQ